MNQNYNPTSLYPGRGSCMKMVVFKELVDANLYQNGDGFGHPSDGKLHDDQILITPAQIQAGEYPRAATHILWFTS